MKFSKQPLAQISVWVIIWLLTWIACLLIVSVIVVVAFWGFLLVHESLPRVNEVGSLGTFHLLILLAHIVGLIISQPLGVLIFVVFSASIFSIAVYKANKDRLPYYGALFGSLIFTPLAWWMVTHRAVILFTASVEFSERMVVFLTIAMAAFGATSGWFGGRIGRFIFSSASIKR